MGFAGREVGMYEEDWVLRLFLPSGTTILPEECGFLTPDLHFLRLYTYGTQEEEMDGTAPGRRLDLSRPQHAAARARLDAEAEGRRTWIEYRIQRDLEVVLPSSLAALSDVELIALTRLIVSRLVELDMGIGESDGEMVAMPGGNERFGLQIIDLSNVGPLGDHPLR